MRRAETDFPLLRAFAFYTFSSPGLMPTSKIAKPLKDVLTLVRFSEL